MDFYKPAQIYSGICLKVLLYTNFTSSKKHLSLEFELWYEYGEIYGMEDVYDTLYKPKLCVLKKAIQTS